MTPEYLEDLWRDPRNHRWGCYYCKADPRAIVPKRIPWMGWTLNFARPSAIPALALILALLLGPYFLVLACGGGMGLAYVFLAISIVVMCLLCAYLSSPRRWLNRNP